MVDPDGHVFWTVMLFTWPYACIPLAFYIDGNLRARWHLEDVSRPASGYRFKGANMQMVFTSKVRREGKLPREKHRQQEHRQQEHVPGRSRWLDCTNLWPLAVVGPAVFVFAAEWSSGALSVLLVCAPFMFFTLFSLTLNQVGACLVDHRPVQRAFTIVREAYDATVVFDLPSRTARSPVGAAAVITYVAALDYSFTQTELCCALLLSSTILLFAS